MMLQFVIPGPPRTKKNHNRIVRAGRLPKVLPSKAYEDWNKQAQFHLLYWKYPEYRGKLKEILGMPVNCCAEFYRERSIGDAVGYYQALADTLEQAGIVENDRLIVSWDGSRLLKDADRPRVEVTIETL